MYNVPADPAPVSKHAPAKWIITTRPAAEAGWLELTITRNGRKEVVAEAPAYPKMAIRAIIGNELRRLNPRSSDTIELPMELFLPRV